MRAARNTMQRNGLANRVSIDSAQIRALRCSVGRHRFFISGGTAIFEVSSPEPSTPGDMVIGQDHGLIAERGLSPHPDMGDGALAVFPRDGVEEVIPCVEHRGMDDGP